MSDRLKLYLGAVIAVIAVAGGFLFALTLRESEPSADSVQALTSFEFKDLDGKTRRLDEFGSQVLVLNFWATWCAPCKEEIPGLIALQAELPPGKATIVGIAVDSAAKVSDFARETRFNYPILIGGAATLEMIRRLGNAPGGLPYTVFVDADGRVYARHLGLITPEALRRQLKGRLG